MKDNLGFEKKILFLRAKTGWRDPSPPMAFAYLGKIAKDKGWKVLVENLNAQYNEKTTEDIIELIRKEKPMIIGVSIFTNYSHNSYDLIRIILKHKEDFKKIIVGGPHVTIYPEEAIERGADIAVVREAEACFADLLEAIEKNKNLDKVKNLVYKNKNGKIKRTRQPKEIDLDKLPMPDKDLERKSDYIKTKEEINNFGGILSSRGCPGRCTYCYHSLFGRGFRYRSAKSVFDEIVYLHKRYGIKHINFIDDAFTINRQRLWDLCEMLIQSKTPVEWVCATRIDFLDKELIFKMKEAGCVMISLGVESCIPEALVKMKKTTNPDWYIKHTEEILKWCYDAGVRVGVNILTGFPWDTKENIKKTQEYVRKIQKYVTQGFCGGVLQPMPNTEDYDNNAEKYKFEKWWLYKKPLFEEGYHPFFMLYYQMFWEQLQNNFFKLDKEVFNEIDKLYKIMGKWNIKIIVKRRFKNPLMRFLVYFSVLNLSRLSFFLYNLSPKLEGALMLSVEKFSYKFKYRS